MGSQHCTCAFTETVDPARRPSIPQVRQGSVRFNLKEEEPPPPSPFPFLLYLFYEWNILTYPILRIAMREFSRILYSFLGVCACRHRDRTKTKLYLYYYKTNLSVLGYIKTILNVVVSVAQLSEGNVYSEAIIIFICKPDNSRHCS